MALPVLPLILLGAAAAGFAVVSKPKKRSSGSVKPSGPQVDPNKPKVIFGLRPETPKFAQDTIDFDAWQTGDVVTFMVGQLDFPDTRIESLGRLYRPEAAALGNKGLQDYRLTDVQTQLTGFAGEEMSTVPYYWQFARIGDNPIAPYSWTFYWDPTEDVDPNEINFSRGSGPSQAAVKVVRDGQLIWQTDAPLPAPGDKIV